MKYNKKDKCPDCGCLLETKYMIRVDYDSTPDGNHHKSHWQSTSRKSVVGWVKFICNEFGNFEEIQIFNLMTECYTHREFHKVDTEKQERLFPQYIKKKNQKLDRSFEIKNSK